MEGGQSIKIKIGSKEYNLKAATPEHESLMRISAETINKMLAAYGATFPMQSEQDRLAFAALNINMQLLAGKKNISDIRNDEKRLLEETDSYLKNIENNSR